MSTSGRRRSFVPLACGLSCSCVNVLGPTKSTIKTRQRFAAIPKSGTRRAKIVRASSIPGGEASVCSPGLYFSNQKKISKIKNQNVLLFCLLSIYMSLYIISLLPNAHALCVHDAFTHSMHGEHTITPHQAPRTPNTTREHSIIQELSASIFRPGERRRPLR